MTRDRQRVRDRDLLESPANLLLCVIYGVSIHMEMKRDKGRKRHRVTERLAYESYKSPSLRSVIEKLT